MLGRGGRGGKGCGGVEVRVWVEKTGKSSKPIFGSGRFCTIIKNFCVPDAKIDFE